MICMDQNFIRSRKVVRLCNVKLFLKKRHSVISLPPLKSGCVSFLPLLTKEGKKTTQKLGLFLGEVMKILPQPLIILN